jgi:putative SOS response-associated peptidase YedK
MCGRFGAEQEYVALARRYQAVVQAIDPGPRYNVAPTDPVPVIVAYQGDRYLAHHRWGLVPHWAKDLSIGARMINARAETVATLPAFRQSFERRRCIIPATRFYEWKRTGGAKQPYTILRTDGEPMSFAGLWAAWRHPVSGERVLSCSIVTTTPNAVVADLHDRMPVVLLDEVLARWLDPEFRDVGQLRALLRPCPDDLLSIYPVSRLVNDVRNDGPDLIAPVSLAEPAR